MGRCALRRLAERANCAELGYHSLQEHLHAAFAGTFLATPPPQSCRTMLQITSQRVCQLSGVGQFVGVFAPHPSLLRIAAARRFASELRGVRMASMAGALGDFA